MKVNKYKKLNNNLEHGLLICKAYLKAIETQQNQPLAWQARINIVIHAA